MTVAAITGWCTGRSVRMRLDDPVVRLVVPLLLLALAVSACNAPQNPRPVLVDAQTFELQRIVEEVQRQSGTPALAAAWTRSDGDVYVAITGVRSIATRQAALPSDYFPVGTITQQFAGAVIVSHIEEGRIRWDTTIEQALPDLARDIRPEYRTATIEQLISHRTRIPAVTRSAQESPFDGPSVNLMPQRQTAVRWALGQPAAPSAPRPTLADIPVLTAVHMTERHAETPFEELLRERLIKRIDPTNCMTPHMGRDSAIEPARHVGSPASPAVAPDKNDDMLPPVFDPVAGVRCSIAGLAQFARVQLRGLRGANQVITAAGVQRLHAPLADAATEPHPAAAQIFGTSAQPAIASTVFQLSGGKRAIWQRAAAQSYAAWMTVLPDDDLAIVVAANAGFGDMACARVTRDVLATLGVRTQ